MGNLILIRGLPGSGKSTLAKLLGSHVHLEADMFHVVDDVYRYDATQNTRAHRWCQVETKIQLNFGYSVVVSNTFVRMLELEPYFQIAKELSIIPLVIETKGNFKSVHDVPKDILDRMAFNWETFNPAYFE